MNQTDINFMVQALKQAQIAEQTGEVPVGAVITCDEQIVAVGSNTRESDKNALCHAEITAIKQACTKLERWRLSDCTLYVTLEPCAMCAGAIVNSRISRVVIGTADPKAGALGSVLNLTDFPLNHKPTVEFGVLEDECRQILQRFFKNLRVKS